MNPYVDTVASGWEADMGVDWKLLENMTVMITLRLLAAWTMV